MRNNSHATPAKASGTKATGNNKPFVNMPANNVGTFPVTMGNTHSSKFAKQTSTGGAKAHGKANMPANNTTDKKVVVGHTKHGVGEVPGYLKGAK